MSTFSFSLKDGINGVNNPSLDGVFSYGTTAGGFTLMDNYGFIGSIISGDQIQAWNVTGDLYPHIGFENLQGNIHVEPQPFPTFGIYLHPGAAGAVVRMTVPFALDANLNGLIQRASTNSGNENIRFSIVKNGVTLLNQFIDPTDGIVPFSQPANTLIAGDVIDFIVRFGSDTISSDDTALEVTLDLSYTQIPTPIITTSPIDCSTTVINGEATFLASGTTASLYSGATLIQSVLVTTVGYNGIFSFTGLNLNSYGGQNLTVILTKAGDTDSLPVNIAVVNANCGVVAIATDKYYTVAINQPVSGNVNLGNTLCGMCLAMISQLPDIIQCLN